MFRVTPWCSNIRKLLCCYRPLDSHLATIIRFQQSNAVYKGDPRPRPPCPTIPPKPDPPIDDKWVWLTMAALFIAGVGIVAAKNSTEVRDWLTLYAPWADDIVAIVYEENMTHREFVTMCYEEMTKAIGDLTAPKKVCTPDGKLIQPGTEKNIGAAAQDVENEDDEVVQCPPVPKPVVTKDICDIEKCMKELGEFAVNNFDTAKVACTLYNDSVEEVMQNFSMKKFKQLFDAQAERMKLVKESINNANNAITRIEDMTKYLDCGVTATKTEIENTKLLFRNYREQYKAAGMLYQWENDKSIVYDTLIKSVDEMMEKYTNEVQNLYPGLDIASQKLTFYGDPDVLLYHTYRIVNHLNDELETESMTLSERVNRAYDGLLKTPEKKKAIEESVNKELAKKKAELDKEYKERYDKQNKNNELKLKRLTKKQQDRHEELVRTRVEELETQLQEKFDKMVEEQVLAEKRIFANQLTDMAMKLEIVENKFNARMKAERETRRSQELWAAGASLLAATKKGGCFINVNKELNAIEKASDGEDKLVMTVLKSIPLVVREVGISPESSLREKYKAMEDTALKVALVEEGGGPMPVYILSWIQAMLLFMKIPGIPQQEYEKPPKEPSNDLDTFDLLQRARFWVERGNLAAAIRYVDKLQGASRLAAHQWVENARAHVEVRQAAEAILAHAAALGLQYI